MQFFYESPRFSFFTLVAVLTMAALATPVLLHFNLVLAAFAIRKFFSVVCHQDPARSYWFWGTPVAICYRCLGIYAGALAGTWWRASRLALLRWTAILVVANAIDVFTETARFHGDLPGARWLLGALLGGGVAALIASSFHRQVADRSAPQA